MILAAAMSRVGMTQDRHRGGWLFRQPEVAFERHSVRRLEPDAPHARHNGHPRPLLHPGDGARRGPLTALVGGAGCVDSRWGYAISTVSTVERGYIR